jgi:hypothetical protein
MSAAAGPQESIDLLRRRLALHALWRAGLVFLPPLLAVWYIVFFLYRFSWLGPDAVMLSGAAVMVAAAALTAARFRARAPSSLLAARLIDEKAAAEDRFVTLATLAPAAGPPEFFSQLHSEAAALARMVDVKKDFPFHIERSILYSIIAALATVLLFQLVLEFAPPGPSGAKLAARAAKLADDSRFTDLAAPLSAAAAKLQGRSLGEGDKQALLADILGQVEDRIAAETARGGDAATLEKIAAEIRQMQKSESSSRFRLPWTNESGEEGGGAGGSGRGSGQGAGNRGGQKSNQQNGAGSGERQSGAKLDGGGQRGEKAEEQKQGSLKRSGREGKEDARQAKGGGENEGGKAAQQKQGDGEGGERSGRGSQGDVQRDGAVGVASDDKPPERFAAPGEKLSGDLKDLRTVIVRLPDEGSAAASGTRPGQTKALAGALPSANVPLAPPADPQAAQEKQMLPLEYRGMIR